MRDRQQELHSWALFAPERDNPKDEVASTEDPWLQLVPIIWALILNPGHRWPYHLDDRLMHRRCLLLHLHSSQSSAAFAAV